MGSFPSCASETVDVTQGGWLQDIRPPPPAGVGAWAAGLRLQHGEGRNRESLIINSHYGPVPGFKTISRCKNCVIAAGAVLV